MVKRLLLIGLVGLAAVSIFVWLRPARHTRTAALKVFLWYWHTPFQVSGEEQGKLQRAGVAGFYVLTGTVVHRSKPTLILPQRWSSGSDLPVHLVFRLDHTIVHALDRADASRLATELFLLIDAEKERAAARVQVKGVQLDMDCPTRLLGRYAALCRELKDRLKGLEFSVTALPTWYTSDQIHQLAGACDVLVPQLYENSLGSSIRGLRPISTQATIDDTLERADRVGKSFMVGLPAYGRALLYDEGGRLAGVQKDISARDALRHPGFSLVKAYPVDEQGREATKETYCGEEVLDLVATRPAPNGRGKGFHLVYLIPSPELVVRHLRLMRAAPARCTAVILFRYPEPGELSTVPLDALLAALRGEPAEPSIRVEAQQRRDPLAAVDAAHKPAVEVDIFLRNDGPGATSVHPEAFVLTLTLDTPESKNSFLARRTRSTPDRP